MSLKKKSTVHLGSKHSTVSHEEERGLTFYLKAALAGGICCSITHGGMTPVDVVKTRIQLDPIKYNQGMVGGFRQVIAAEGAGALLTGLGPTAMGYFVQGWFKFGGVEFFKIKMATSAGPQKAWDNRNAIYLASAGCAEAIADIFVCPFEAVRIRLVSDPKFASGLAGGAARIMKEDGLIPGFYSGFGPILFKQVPYTMAKFSVQGIAAEAIAGASNINLQTASDSTKMAVALTSGTMAGVAAAIISHPADSLLSLVNKSPDAGGNGGMASKLINITKEVGIGKLCTNGLAARCVMIGTLTAGQFAIFDVVMAAIGAEKFHFHDPNEA